MLQKIDGAWWDNAPVHHSNPADILEAIESQTTNSEEAEEILALFM